MGMGRFDKLFKELPKDRQVKWLKEELTSAISGGEEDMELIAILENVVEDPVRFREILRECFVSGVSPENRPNLCTRLLKEILEGWDWHYEEMRLVAEKDARDCLLFFCEVLATAQRYELFGKSTHDIWVALLHNHINRHKNRASGTWWWKFEDLDCWILDPRVTDEVKVILAGVRIRIGGAGLLVPEIKLSQAFRAHEQSPEAIELACQVLNRVTIFERLRADLIQILCSPKSPLIPKDKIEWFFLSASAARIEITLSRHLKPSPVAENIQKLVDQALTPYNECASPPFIVSVTVI